MASFIWLMGVWASWQQPLHTLIFLQEKSYSDFTEPFPENELFSQLLTRLIHLFENKKVYLNPDLTLQEVARELGTNRTYLSRLINSHFDQNFSAFVNTYRAKEANDLIRKSGKMTHSELAHRAGFGSVSSMKRVIKYHDTSDSTFL